MGKRCIATKPDGSPCSSWAVADSDFCFFHDPAKARERAEAHKRGGQRNRAEHGGDSDAVPAKIRTLEDVLALLDYTLAETIVLDNSIARGRLLVSLAGEYINAIQVGEQEQRLEALERIIYGQNNTPR